MAVRGGSDTYTVTFQIAGDGCPCEAGTVVTTMSVRKGESLTLPSLGDCDSGEASYSWSTDPDGTEGVGETGKSYTPVADITLYASCPTE